MSISIGSWAHDNPSYSMTVAGPTILARKPPIEFRASTDQPRDAHVNEEGRGRGSTVTFPP